MERLKVLLMVLVVTFGSPGVGVAGSDYQGAEVELYITSWCGYCRKAREFLQSQGISFIEYDIEKDPGAAERKQEIAAGAGIPVAVINGQIVRGFSKAAYEKALRSRPSLP
ncbi:MAG: glutaredoxin domain-containing protein [Candidatus Binatia bacterium]